MRSPKSRCIVTTACAASTSWSARDEADDIRQARESLDVAVGHAHAAAGQQIVTGEFSVFLDGDKAQAVREHVNVIERRNDKRRLEFARQVGLAVERINKTFRGLVLQFQLLAFHPDLVIRRGLGQQSVGNFARVGLHLFHQRVGRRGGGAHDVAVHVAARREGCGQRFVDGLHHRPEAGLHDAVELEPLARSDPQRVVAVPARKLVKSQVMLRLDHPARQTPAHHENIVLLHLALVPVVLLIDAVKFQKFVVILGEPLNGRVGQRLANGAGKSRAGLFKSFIPNKFCRCSACNHKLLTQVTQD